MVSGAAVSPALPTIAAAFTDVPHYELLVQLVLTVPALFIAIGSPVAGWLCDRWGRRPVLIASIFLYAAAGGSGFVLDNLYAILVGRAVLGLTVAGIITSCSTLIGDYFEGHDRERVMGQQAAFMSYSGVVFPLASGVLAGFGWSYPFLVYLAALAVLPGIFASVYEPARQHHEAASGDGAATPAHSLWLVGLIYALAIITFVAFYMLPVQLPFYLEELTGGGAKQAGLALAGVSACAGTASLRFRWVKRGFSSPGLIALTFTLIAAGFLLMARAEGYGLLTAGIVLSGIGLGWTTPNLSVWLLNGIPERVRGRFIGGFSTSVFLGQFLSPIAARPFVDVGGYAYAYAAVGWILAGLGGAFALQRLWRRAGKKPTIRASGSLSGEVHHDCERHDSN